MTEPAPTGSLDLSTLNTIPNAVWIGDFDAHCVFANECLARLLGVDAGALLGTGWLAFLPAEDRETVLHKILLLARGRSGFRTRLRLQLRGRTRTFRAEGAVLPPSLKEPGRILLSLQDITYSSRYSFQRQLRSEQMRICFEHAPVGIAFLDTKLRFVRANPSIIRLSSAPDTTPEGAQLHDALSGLDPQSAREIVRICNETLSSGTPHALHDWPVMENGGIRYTDWEIRRIETTERVPVGLLLSVNDVTSAHEYKNALTRAHENLERRVQQRTAELAEATSVIQDRARQQAAVAELGARALSGMDAQDLLEEAAEQVLQILKVDFCSIRELSADHTQLELRASAGWPPEVVHEPIPAGNSSQSGFAVATRKPVIVEDVRTEKRFAISPSALRMGCISSISVVIAFEEEPFGSLSAFCKQRRSFTEDDTHFLQSVANIIAAAIQRQRSEEGLRLAREQAEQANRAKGAFLSRMSHELRTPLNAILGFAQILQLENTTESQRESIDHITRAGTHLLSLINEVLDMARIEAGKLTLTLEPIDLTGFLGPCVELMRPIADSHSVRLVLHPPRENVHARGDRQRLQQLVINFLSNAIKYNFSGGSVEVFVETGPQLARLHVKDSGPGIPEPFRERLFKPFERLGAESGAAEGTGIGLALCRGLMLAMQGNIGLDCPPGGGCDFWAELPLSHPDDDPTPRLEDLTDPLFSPPEFSERRDQMTVLCIDSRESELRELETLLHKHHGYRFLSTTQASEAVRIAKEHPPSVILLGNAPDNLGTAEFLARMEEEPALKRARLIQITQVQDGAQSPMQPNPRFIGSLSKPYRLEELLLLLGTALQHSGARPTGG